MRKFAASVQKYRINHSTDFKIAFSPESTMTAGQEGRTSPGGDIAPRHRRRWLRQKKSTSRTLMPTKPTRKSSPPSSYLTFSCHKSMKPRHSLPISPLSPLPSLYLNPLPPSSLFLLAISSFRVFAILPNKKFVNPLSLHDLHSNFYFFVETGPMTVVESILENTIHSYTSAHRSED
jgi:hypothetical protein